MNYEIKYRESEVGDQIDEFYRLERLPYPGPCRVCGKHTHFMNVDHEELSCSEECSRLYQLLINKRDIIFSMDRRVTRITPERCYVLFKERDEQGKRIRKYGWATGTINLNHFFVLYDSGETGFVPLKRTAFTSKNPHIDINRFRENKK